MNLRKYMTAIAVALTCSTCVLVACSDDEPETKEERLDYPIQLFGAHAGWSKATVHNVPVKSPDESIEIIENEDGTVNLAYTSSVWGTATLKNVTMTKGEQGYTFAKPISVAENEEHTAWIFPDNVDYISMVQRGPAASGTPTPKLYPFVLDKGFISNDLQTYEFTFSAYLNLTGAGIYTITFQNNPFEEDEAVI